MEINVTSVDQLKAETNKLVKAGARKILKGTNLPLNTYTGTTTGKLTIINTKGREGAEGGFIIYSGLVEVTLNGNKQLEAVSCIDENEAASLLSVGQVVGFEVVESDKLNAKGEPYKQVRLTAVQLSGNQNIGTKKTTKKVK